MKLDIGSIRRWLTRPQAVAAKRPPELPDGSWLDDFRPLSRAEQRLVDRVAIGMPCRLGTTRPTEGNVGNTVRAAIIRFLVLGGDEQHPVHDLGVWLERAWVKGDLDLESVCSKVSIALRDCHLSGLFRAVDAELPGLNLEGTLLQGIDAARLKVKGSVFLRNGVEATAEVRLQGAEIGGNLDCDGSEFCDSPIASDAALRGTRQVVNAAIRADGIIVRGDVLMGGNEKVTDEKTFLANGEVRLTGAKIDGNLTCSKGRFRSKPVAEGNQLDITETPAALRASAALIKGDVYLNKSFSSHGLVDLSGITIEGSLHCSTGMFENEPDPKRITVALYAQRAIIKGKLELLSTFFRGEIDLTAARVGSLIDGSATCWPKSRLHIDGFHYDRISLSSIDAHTRIGWLRTQVRADREEGFKPQPWQQLIKVLRDMGHPDEAAKVAIEKEKLWGKSGQMSLIRRILHRSHGWFGSYGHRPMTTVWWIAGLWLLFSGIYFCAWRDGLFNAAAPAVQIRLEDCRRKNPAQTCNPPAEYPMFEPLIYSADLILPFVDLQQESNWLARVSREDPNLLSAGRVVRAIAWAEIIAGWLLSLMLLTALGRVLNRD